MKKIIALLLATASSFTFAGAGTGKILGYLPFSAGSTEIFFVNSENNLNQISCNTTNRYAMSASDPKYKSTQAALMAAFMAGSQVVVKGKGSCNVWANAEDIDYICLGTIPC